MDVPPHISQCLSAGVLIGKPGSTTSVLCKNSPRAAEGVGDHPACEDSWGLREGT